MSPQFVDFDGDGFIDIITATYEGTAFIVRGSKDGWQQPEHLKDGQGRNIVLSLYYDTQANRYDNAERSPEGKENPKDHCVSAVAFDWNNNGVFDLLLGSYEGRLYLQRNEGKPGEPKFTGINELLTAGGKPFEVPGGLTAPRLVDWTGNGLMDLVCGSFAGGVYLFRNVGEPGAPAFAAADVLIAPGEIKAGELRFPNKGVYADPVDYDGDGRIDLLVGGYAEWHPEAPNLSDADRARLTKLEDEISTVQIEVQKYYEKAQEEASAAETQDLANAVFARLFENDSFRALQQQSQELHNELRKLRPPARRDPGVWLYRRK